MKRLFMRFVNHKLNNQGSTLLTVIICIAFISILGSLMLSVTMTNLQMKLVESKSKKNFYSCETVMEEIRTAAQEIASEAVRSVYVDDVLVNFASYLTETEVDRNQKIQKKVIAKFLETVCGADLESIGYEAVVTKAISGGGYDITTDFFQKYLGASSSMVTWSKITCDDTTPYAIRLKGIMIEYDIDGYRTAITSDIVITLPKFSFSEGTEKAVYRMLQPYQQYVLVADGTITSDNPDGVTNIQGNVYSGEGIRINGQNNGSHQVNIYGDTIVTRKDITVSDTATLNIGASATKPMIWAKNLFTYTSVGSGYTYPTNLNINGISIIRDDLTLNGINSNVTLNSDNRASGIGGAYIGYTGTHDSLGSSIIINGSGSSLDLSFLNDLILAGRAHVFVADPALNKEANIMTGESLAFKSNQRAYLMPAKFITNVLHNPVSQDDPSPDLLIDDSEEVIKYNSYLAPVPYKIAAKQTDTTILRYYYLNFASGKLADSFMKTFYGLYRNDILSNMEPFSLGNVILPDNPSVISAVGNIMSYDSVSGINLTDGMSYDTASYPDDATLDTAISGMPLNDPVYVDTVLEGKSVNSLEDMYSKVSHLLSYDSTRTYNEEDKTVASTIKNGGIDYIITHDLNLNAPGMELNKKEDLINPVVFKETDPTKQYFWVINGNVVIDLPDDPTATTVFNGILLATGTVTIRDNAQVNGLIISTGELGSGDITVGNDVTLNGRLVTKGNINLGKNCTFGTNADMNTYLDDVFHSEGTILSYIFKNSEMTIDYTLTQPASNMVDLTNMVSYDNWRKIE